MNDRPYIWNQGTPLDLLIERDRSNREITERVQLIRVDGIYFSENALEYFIETYKDRFKKFLVDAVNPKYEPFTDSQLIDIEGMQVTYDAGRLGKPMNTIPIKLPDDIEISSHANDKMEAGKISKDHLQAYIDNSLFMFDQQNGKTRLYVSSTGSVVISIKVNPDGLVVTVYLAKDYYSDQLGPIIEEVKKWVKLATTK